MTDVDSVVDVVWTVVGVDVVVDTIVVEGCAMVVVPSVEVTIVVVDSVVEVVWVVVEVEISVLSLKLYWISWENTKN
jgi:hypothetical protein